MDNNNTQYDKRLSEYKDRMLQRNKELTMDDDDIIDEIINASEKKDVPVSEHPVFTEPVRTKEPVSDSYKEYADKLEAALKTANANKTKTAEINTEPSTELKARTDMKTSARADVKTDTKRGYTEVAIPETKKKYGSSIQKDEIAVSDDIDDEYDDYDDGRTAAEVFTSIKKGAGNIVHGLTEFAKDRWRDFRNGDHKLTGTAKWTIAGLILLVVFIIVTLCYVSANKTYKYNQMDIRPIESSDLIVNDGVKAETKGYTTIALYGVDSRDSNLNTGTNSDAIIIVSINDDTKEVKLVSVYRDTLLQIQNDSLTTQKVNYAYQLGGSLMSINTLNANLDLQITDYITVDFGAMADIVDALGGVEVTIEEDEINNLNKNLAEQISISGVYSDGVHSAGTQTLNGQQAVAYSRIRSTGQGDITRTERQRNILTALFETVSNAGKDTLSDLVDVSFECISTSFTKDEVTDLIKDVSDYSISDTTGFPFAYETMSLGDKGSIIAAADLSANVTALHEYLYGNTSYTPSSNASDISGILASETGISASGDIDISSSSDTNGLETDDEETTEDSVTITSPPDGMIENE